MIRSSMVHNIFFDTGAFIALNDQSDQYHQVAKSFLSHLLNKETIHSFTSNLVIAESYTRILYKSTNQVAYEFLNILSDSKITILYSDKPCEESCYNFLKKFKGEKISYTDAVSFQLMKDNFIKDAFAFDWHFQLAGFNILPGTLK